MDSHFDFSDLDAEIPGLNDTVPDLVGMNTMASMLPLVAGPTSGPPLVEADLTPRVLAKLIDVGIGAALSWLVALPFYGWFTGLLVGGVVGSAYVLASDALNGPKTRSLGKQWLDLRIEQRSGKDVDLVASVRRNWMFAGLYAAQAFVIVAPALSVLLLLVTAGGLAFEFRTLFYDYEGQRWGDVWAGTRVLQRARPATTRQACETGTSPTS